MSPVTYRVNGQIVDAHGNVYNADGEVIKAAPAQAEQSPSTPGAVTYRVGGQTVDGHGNIISSEADDESSVVPPMPPAPVPVAVPSVDSSVDLGALTVAELREMASDADISGYSGMRKDELIAALEGAA